jgi:ribosomal protein L1
MSMKPSAVKGAYVKSAFISATMSPSVRLAISA